MFGWGKIPLVNSDLSTAEFGSGVMVLPVEYTKGLEFDAVLLYHPSEEHYPSEDAYVKLLYVAATRALHELAVVHTGDLTDLIGTKVSEEKGSIRWKIRSTRSLRHSGKAGPCGEKGS
ncbi:MAG: ATP-binding domain-containing protein [Blautia sp.]